MPLIRLHLTPRAFLSYGVGQRYEFVVGQPEDSSVQPLRGSELLVGSLGGRATGQPVLTRCPAERLTLRGWALAAGQ